MDREDIALVRPFNPVPGYDYDLCRPESLRYASVRDGRIAFPSGMSYR